MSFDEAERIRRAYYRRFGDPGDARRMSVEAVENLDYLMAAALARGSKIRDEELGMGHVPEGVVI